MKIVFGDNRRQKPIELLCPGGKIVVSREFGGAVLVKVVADAGRVKAAADNEWHAAVRLERED